MDSAGPKGNAPEPVQDPHLPTQNMEKDGPQIIDEDAADIAMAEALRTYVPDTAEEKRLVRKIDFVLLPTLWFMSVFLKWSSPRCFLLSNSPKVHSRVFGPRQHRQCKCRRYERGSRHVRQP